MSGIAPSGLYRLERHDMANPRIGQAFSILTGRYDLGIWAGQWNVRNYPPRSFTFFRRSLLTPSLSRFVVPVSGSREHIGIGACLARTNFL